MPIKLAFLALLLTLVSSVAAADDDKTSGDTRTPAPAAKTPLKVEILTPKEPAPQNRAVVRFTNTSIDPVFILKPLDGSLHGWHMPHYHFEVTGKDGAALKLRGRCGLSGLWHETAFPKDYLVEIKPGKSFESRHYLPFAVPADGEYTVTFTYRYQPGKATFKNPTWGVAEQSWQGAVSSKALKMKLRGNVQPRE